MKKISENTLKNVLLFIDDSPIEIGDSVSEAFSTLKIENQKDHPDLNLSKIFKIQEGLNNLIFHKQKITSSKGDQLTIKKLLEDFESGPIGPNSDSTKWALKFLRALREEADELEESLPWKWWSKDETDKQNAIVEVADLLFFLVCIAQSLGLDGKKLSSLYLQKAVVNFERQFKGYSKATKDENDNKEISA